MTRKDHNRVKKILEDTTHSIRIQLEQAGKQRYDQENIPSRSSNEDSNEMGKLPDDFAEDLKVTDNTDSVVTLMKLLLVL